MHIRLRKDCRDEEWNIESIPLIIFQKKDNGKNIILKN